jgi:hypothetical protein
VRIDPGRDELPVALTGAERNRRYKKKQSAAKPPIRIAILDMETDPFDNVNETPVYPFLAVLYTKECPPIIIWDENYDSLTRRVRDAILDLPGRYIIYAHNGGRFDYLLLLRELRGEVMFKGRSLMSAKIGPHELRDSFHIIPESLKNANRKMEMDYSCFTKSRRNVHRDAIITYCIDDCESLYEIVSVFHEKFGTPLTIGQAAMSELRKHYKFERMPELADDYLRQWFFGGRVECLKTGIIQAPLNLYDVNSMYPHVMATYQHPVSSSFDIGRRLRGDTIFITLHCKNRGALVCRADDGSLTTQCTEGVFNTTIWEYEVARKHGLISDVEIIRTLQFPQLTDFSKFILPLYTLRQSAKEALQTADPFTARNLTRDILFYKLLMNNAYGKFAQNPRRFKQHFITEPMTRPDDNAFEWGDLPDIETDGYWIWSQPTPEHRYNNVATAASITGAARAVLLDALASCDNPVYCDTDSIICSRLDDRQHIDKLALGAWDIEASMHTFIGNGKKLYAYKRCDREPPKDVVVKAKGVAGVTWDEMMQVAAGQTIVKKMSGPTIGADGSQHYLARELRATTRGLTNQPLF